jgi:hypothetical protein
VGRSQRRSGTAVIRYEGARTTSWRIKYRDATGRQIQETPGCEPASNRARAERELGKRLAAVETGFRKADKVTSAGAQGCLSSALANDVVTW